MRLTNLKLSDDVQYIRWNYETKPETEEEVHLIRLSNGKKILKTSKEMIQLGLAERK